jgi:beta-mannosidase
VLSAWTLDGQLVTSTERTVSLPPNQALELSEFGYEVNRDLVVGARLFSEHTLLTRATLWAEPFKYLTLPEPDIALTRAGDQLTLRAARSAKGVWLEAGDEVGWSDNFIDLLPGEDYTITAQGLGEQPVKMRWLSG